MKISEVIHVIARQLDHKVLAPDPATPLAIVYKVPNGTDALEVELIKKVIIAQWQYAVIKSTPRLAPISGIARSLITKGDLLSVGFKSKVDLTSFCEPKVAWSGLEACGINYLKYYDSIAGPLITIEGHFVWYYDDTKGGWNINSIYKKAAHLCALMAYNVDFGA